MRVSLRVPLTGTIATVKAAVSELTREQRKVEMRERRERERRKNRTCEGQREKRDRRRGTTWKDWWNEIRYETNTDARCCRFGTKHSLMAFYLIHEISPTKRS